MIRYNIMSTNNEKLLNSLLKSVQEFFIVGLIEYIWEILQMWFYERYAEAEKCISHLTSPLEKKIWMKYNESNGLEVNQVSPNIYQADDNLEHYFVNLDKTTCCRKFDLDKFPCTHTVAIIRFKWDDNYNLSKPFYINFCWK